MIGWKLRGLAGLNQPRARRANQPPSRRTLNDRGAIVVVRLRQWWTIGTVVLAHGTAVGELSLSLKSTRSGWHQLVMRPSHVPSLRGNVRVRGVHDWTPAGAVASPQDLYRPWENSACKSPRWNYRDVDEGWAVIGV